MVVIEQLAVSNSTVLNQELNWGSTDWNKKADLIKSLLSQPIKCNDSEKKACVCRISHSTCFALEL